MKKVAVLSVLFGATLLTACSQNPQTNAQQTFGSALPNAPITVQQALSANDDSYVTLEGTILSRLDSDEYLFADASGKIRVEIDEHIWQGQTVSAKDKIQIYGEIDKEWDKTELKVHKLTILK